MTFLCFNKIAMKTNSKPKILFIDHSADMGGAEYVLLDILKNYPNSQIALLSKGRFEKFLIAQKIHVKIIPFSEKIRLISKNNLNIFKEIWALPTIVKTAYKIARLSKNFDLIYANSQKAFILGAIAGKIAHKPVIWHLHDILTQDHFSPKNIWLDVYLANHNARSVIANSQATADSFTGHGGHKDLVKVVYNSIESKPFLKVNSRKARALKNKFNPKNKPLIGLFGRIAFWKGQHVAIAAMKSLPNFQLLIVGSPLKSSLDYSHKLQLQIKKLGLARQIKMIGSRTDVPELMSICDIIIHTSVAPEPFGRVIVEGMLSKKPVIATAGGGVLEIIEDRVSGYLVPMNSTQKLSSAINKVLDNPEKSKIIAEAGYQRAIKQFTGKKMVQQIDTIIKRQINKSM